MLEKIIALTPQPLLVAGANLNQRQVVELPRGYLYKNLLLYVTAIITDNGAGAAPVYSQDAPHRLLQRVRVRTHADTPVDISGRLLALSQEFNNRVAMDNFATVAAIGAAHRLSAAFEVPFGDENANVPQMYETYIKAWGLKKFELEYVSPDLLAELMVPGAGGAIVFTSWQVLVFATVYEVTPEEKAMLDRSAVGLKRLIENIENLPAAAAGAMHPFRDRNLNRGYMTTRLYGMMVDTIGGVAGIRLDGLILDTEVAHRDVPIIMQQPAEFMQFETTQRIGFNALAGMYLWELDREGAHLSAPISTEEENFVMRFAHGASTGVCWLAVAQEEIAPAQYAPIGT